VSVAAFAFPGCGGGGASSGSNPPPPPAVTVVVAPSNGNVLLGKTLQLSATVTGSSNTAVTWSVSAGGGAVSASGVYTAPADLPAQATVRVTATSVADPAASDSAEITVNSDIAVTVAPTGISVELGASQSFSAALSSSGNPDNSVRWSLSGGGCPGSCGSIDANGNYTAPQILPASPVVTVTAQSVADPTKQASTAVTIASDFTLQLAAPSSVPTSASASLLATMTAPTGSHPDDGINWSLSGAGCSGASCGTLASGSNPDAATYTAPANAPSPNSVTITATAVADPRKKAQATFAVQAGVSVTLALAAATLATNHRLTLGAQVQGTSNTGLNWTVNGAAEGSASAGLLCVVNSNPCAPIQNPSSASQVDYLAPGALPFPNPVTILATSVVDPSKSAAALVTVINHVVVSVLPASVALAPGAVQHFSASVLGSANQSVVWQLQGPACAASGACGAMASDGTYSAPASAPSPNTITLVAISSDDTTQSASALITISPGATIQSLHPASVYAGGLGGFLLRVDGGGFAATSPGPGSTLLIGGVARATSCTSAGECTAPVLPAEVALPRDISVQMQNPGGGVSNVVSLVVLAPGSGTASISLTAANPTATGEDILVVQPATAGVSQPGADVDLNLEALGAFNAGTNSCVLSGNPVVITRPSSGSALADICVFSQSGLDPSMTYTISGSGDISVAAKQPAGLGIVHLTLQVNASAQAGSRSLFIQNSNLDRAAASGVLEVQ